MIGHRCSGSSAPHNGQYSCRPEWMATVTFMSPPCRPPRDQSTPVTDRRAVCRSQSHSSAPSIGDSFAIAPLPITGAQTPVLRLQRSRVPVRHDPSAEARYALLRPRSPVAVNVQVGRIAQASAMSSPTKTLRLTVERVFDGTPSDVFRGWLQHVWREGGGLGTPTIREQGDVDTGAGEIRR